MRTFIHFNWRNSLTQNPTRRRLRISRSLYFTLIALAPSALPQTAQSQNFNTAYGQNAGSTYGNRNSAFGYSALNNNSSNDNTAVGNQTLLANVSGTENTAIGSEALVGSFDSNGEPNSTGSFNTATGFQALFSLSTGNYNVANGAQALQSNTSGGGNTATGVDALFSNTTGIDNVASGFQALMANTKGSGDVADGALALWKNTTGGYNTALGISALHENVAGNQNTGIGTNALYNSTGTNNTALGFEAGQNLTTGSNNIVIGANVLGKAGDANKIAIGKQGTQTATYIAGISGKTVASGSAVAVFVDNTGKLGTVKSSARYKEAIKPMDKTSEALLKLEPVNFRYKQELDPDGVTQFGLIAEQVEKVDPDLVVRDEDGGVNTVRYEAVNAMLLNEFLKEHRRTQEQVAKVAELESRLAGQQKQIESLTDGLQKVQFELTHPVLHVAVNKENPHFNINH